jgi:hypothetical protein
MKTSRHLALWFAAAGWLAAQAAPPPGDWILPNFAHRLRVRVSGPAGRPVRGLATVPVTPAQALAPGFPGTLAIAVLESEAGTAPSILPSQVDDLDGDGAPDQVEFPLSLNPGEQRLVSIYYSTTLRDSISYPQQVQAKHNYGYNFQTATLESELIGYRTYGAFFLDVQARVAGHPGLHNDLVGYLSIRRDFDLGRDIFHAGETLGLGGLFLRREGRIYQPPFNVPDYAHRPQPPLVPHYRVVAQGPLRAIVEATLDRWEIDGDLFRLDARYSIDAGEAFVRCRVAAVPLRIAAGRRYDFGIGVRDLPGQTLANGRGRAIVVGEQEARNGPFGLAVYFDPADFDSAPPVHTREADNQVAVSRRPLAAGQALQLEYAAAAAWSRSGISDLATYLINLKNAIDSRLVVSDFRYEPTPRPEKVDAEAQ